MERSPQVDTNLASEVETLRARVKQLEAQLLAVEDWANRAVGSAQQRSYWLDRWHVDLNAVMARPAADRARSAFRRFRSVYRFAVRTKHRLTRGS